MLTSRIIPCLDVRDGRIVKGVRFQNLRDAGDPAGRALLYEQQGADELVLLDVSATIEGRQAMLDTVASVREVLSIPLTVGGGVKEPGHAAALLRAGADKVGINSAAVRDPSIIEEMSRRFGAQCTVIAIDAARDGDGWIVVTRAGTRREKLDAIGWAREAERRGAGEILLTSWDRDGTRSGYDLELLRGVTSAVEIPVIASGGADTVAHMHEALEAGAHAVLAASIFHDNNSTVAEVKGRLRELGSEVRL